jgi:hypothetical protein
MVSTRGQDAIGFFPLLVVPAQLPDNADILKRQTSTQVAPLT